MGMSLAAHRLRATSLKAETSGSRPPSIRPVGMRLGTNRDEREREQRAIKPLHGERLPTPSANEGDTTALVHTGKMPGPGSGFPEKDKIMGNPPKSRPPAWV